MTIRKKVGVILGIIGLIAAHIATAAPTSTNVQNLFITGLKSSPTANLTIDANGLVATSTAGGGSGSSTNVFGVSPIVVSQSGTNATTSCPTCIATNTGNWAGTWQGVNSTTFYLASNPSNFISSSTGNTLYYPLSSNPSNYLTTALLTLDGLTTSSITFATSTSAGTWNITTSNGNRITWTIPPAGDQYFAPSTTIPTNNNQLTNGAGYITTSTNNFGGMTTASATALFVQGQGSGVNGDCAKWNSSSSITDAGPSCGAGGSTSGTILSAPQYALGYYSQSPSGTIITGTSTATFTPGSLTATTTVQFGSTSSSVCLVTGTGSSTFVYSTYYGTGQVIVSTSPCT